jgi:hypothetical protein
VLTKLQIAFCVLTGLGLIVFAAGMYAAEKQGENRVANAGKLPGWLAPVALGSIGLSLASCVGVLTTLALDREKPPEPEEDEEAELLPVDEPLPQGTEPEAEDLAPDDLTTVGGAETATFEAAAMEFTEFTEPGDAETIEFSTLPQDE